MIQEAAREWTRTEKWFPKPAELINLANEIYADRVHNVFRGLPRIGDRAYAPHEFEALLQVEKRAAAMNVALHPNVAAAIEQAHMWKRALGDGVA